MGKKIYTFKASDSESAYIKNMVAENGINKKRHGWGVLGSFLDESYEPLPINGIHHRNGEDTILVHAGDRLYKCDRQLSVRQRLLFGEADTFQNQRSQSRMCGDTLFLGGLGHLLGYGEDGLFSIYEHPRAYVPTTSVGICELHTGQAPITMESPSLITRKRINTMRATKSERSEHRFLLDGVVDYSAPIRLKVSFRVKCTDDWDDETTSPYIGIDEAGDEVNTIVTVECSVPRVGVGTMHSYVKAHDANGRVITVKDAEFRWRISGGRELVLYFHGISPVLNQDNIELEYSDVTPLSHELDGASVIDVSSAKEGGEVLLVGCGSKLYFSQRERGAFYFPASNALSIGGGDPITAVMPSTGGDIIVYKRESTYWLKPQGNTYDIIFLSYSYGAESPFSVACLGDDIVAFGKGGVCGIMWQGANDTKSAQIYERGRSLPALLASLDDKEKEKAFSLVHKDTYYLFIGNSAYIASAQATRGKGQDFEYEWRVFDPCPALSALSLGDTLYMGRENGNIAIFDKGYTDRERLLLESSAGDFVIKNPGYSVITFNELAGICEGDKISLGTHFVLVSGCLYKKDSGLVQLSQPSFFDKSGAAAFYEGMEVILADGKCNLVCQGTIIDTDPSECTITVSGVNLEADTALMIFLEKGDSERYELVASNSGYALYNGDSPIRLFSTDVERVYIENPQEIECVLSTPITDLGSTCKKTLSQIRITLSEDTRGLLEVGYDTRKNSFRRAVLAGGNFDLERLDFGTFTFDPRMKKAVAIKCLERNFDHIRIKLSSTSCKELGVEKITVVYTEKGI